MKLAIIAIVILATAVGAGAGGSNYAVAPGARPQFEGKISE